MKSHKTRSCSLVIICLVTGIVCTGLVSADPAGKQYLTIDPPGSQSIGDLLMISGTTDLGEGTELSIQIQGAQYNTGTKVIKGDGGINRWSLPVDTSIIRPGSYLVHVREVRGFNQEKKEFLYGTVEESAPLTLTGTFLASDTSASLKNQDHAYIALDPVPDHKKGDQFLITGTTNLTVGTEVLWEINPTILQKENISGDLNLTGSMANSMVTKGVEEDRVTFALDTNVLNPDEYNVTVTAFEGEPFIETMVRSNISNSTVFTLR